MKIEDPSWRELDNFVCFLNTQLLCYENSSFTNTILAPELGAQFNAFVVKFMITMSEEFATRSLKISEGAGVLEEHALEKLWDKTFHPYLFFNNDGMSFTFIGFKIQAPGDLVDVVTNEIRKRDFMNQDLLGRLRGQRVTFKDDYKAYTPELLMSKLESVLDLRIGRVQPAIDYQLTLDNTIKILAIHMRMRSNIPVVIMGETGCGKTRLIAFMCDIIKQSILSKFDDQNVPENINNLITLRVHGGITSRMISDKIIEAEEQALINKTIDDRFETIVFFDEANATSEIDLIREIMCNHTINGRRINSSIRFIAAVNPYRKHTPVSPAQYHIAFLLNQSQFLTNKFNEAILNCNYSTENSKKTHFGVEISLVYDFPNPGNDRTAEESGVRIQDRGCRCGRSYWGHPPP